MGSLRIAAQTRCAAEPTFLMQDPNTPAAPRADMCRDSQRSQPAQDTVLSTFAFGLGMILWPTAMLWLAVWAVEVAS